MFVREDAFNDPCLHSGSLPFLECFQEVVQFPYFLLGFLIMLVFFLSLLKNTKLWSVCVTFQSENTVWTFIIDKCLKMSCAFFLLVIKWLTEYDFSSKFSYLWKTCEMQLHWNFQAGTWNSHSILNLRQSLTINTLMENKSIELPLSIYSLMTF